VRDYLLAYAFVQQLAGGAYSDMDAAYRYAIAEVSDTHYRATMQQHYTALTALCVGCMAPPVELRGVSGKVETLAQYRGKTVVLEFWHSGCLPCLQGFAAGNAFERSLPDSVVLVYVSVDADAMQWRKTLRMHQVQGVHLIAPGPAHPVVVAYQVNAYPTVFLIGPDGRIINNNAPRPGTTELNQLLKPTLAR
jgi:peroxiredoxin